MSDAAVLDWLLAGDPAIRWQTLRDLLDAPEEQWRYERALVETEGWGAELLQLQDDDGQWAGGAFLPKGFAWEQMQDEGQPWTATCWVLTDLQALGLPADSPCVQRTVELVGENSRWDHDGQPYWQGEVEECINGRTVAQGAYLGVDITPILELLLTQQMADGGWNCESEMGSERSSFDSTLNVLEGLLEYERATGGTEESRTARQAGEEYLLQRRLLYRASTGEIVDEDYLKFSFPSRGRYDLLRALDYFRDAGAFTHELPDSRLADGIGRLQGSRQPDGSWHVGKTYRGRSWFPMAPGEWEPSQWITLKALRVLKWWSG
ncbi:squalene cyclase [Nesterenkonia sp. MY13]|uniref:Squalene cyclase n=1 Tax=Nesterenkonia sedimenti TaxID=1463632 RepID=A0A7X8TH34_9MICC|nr:squalene cyclase [Nesterenkonia sedimenti]NLS08583.1 squalene cyclase [Nesterenkonia sedimenti]